MKIARILFVVAILAGVFFAYQSCRPVDYANLPPRANGDWVAFGDSLTSGVGAAEGSDFPALLAQQLGVTIRNYGVPGNTTQDGLARLDEVLALQPRVVLLGLGGNDALRSVPSEETFANLATMIDRFHDAGSFVVLIGIRSASFRDTNAARFKKLAKEKQVFLVPNILDGVLGSPKLMADYIHPNEAGYRVIADRLQAELQPLLGRINGDNADQ